MNAAERAKILILHGAGGAAVEMQPLADALRATADVFVPNMLAHGGRPIPDRLTIEDTAADVIAYLDGLGVAKTFVFGFSSGGMVALYLARHFPQRFCGVITLAAKYVFDSRTIAHWTYLSDPERLRRSGVAAANMLEEIHKPQDWVDVARAVSAWVSELGSNAPLRDDDLRTIMLPALVFASNEDQIVPLEESLALGKLMRNGKVVLFRGQCHPLHAVPIDAMACAIRDWIGALCPESAPAGVE